MSIWSHIEYVTNSVGSSRRARRYGPALTATLISVAVILGYFGLRMA